MSESADYTPAPWAGGHDFSSVKRSYMDVNVARGASVSPTALGIKDLVPEELVCDAEAPFLLGIDVTGSMGEWPATICSKLPYLEHEGKEYLGQDMQIAFLAIGDANKGDKYPLQVRPFAEGANLKTEIDKLIIERGGGGGGEESYDLAALYVARNCKCPNAIRKPVFIIIGDEGVYNFIDNDIAKTHCKVDLKQRTTPEEIFAELQQKFAVYVVRKNYGSGTEENPGSEEKKIRNQWIGLLGEDHVVSLPDPARVVDVIFGILAKETGRIAYFNKELKDRQGKDSGGAKKIEVVLKSLRTVHNPASLKKLPAPSRAKSVTNRKSVAGKKSISLLDDDK